MLDHLPERERPAVKQRLRRAWALDDHARALDQLRRLAGELDRAYPGAAGSLREGMEETLTLTRLGVTGSLKRTLEIDQPVRVDDRDRPPHPAQREALVVGRDGAALDRRRHARSRTAVSEDHRLPRPRHPRRRDRTRPRPLAVTPSTPLTPRPRRPLSSQRCNDHTGTAVTKFHGDRDILLHQLRPAGRRLRVLLAARAVERGGGRLAEDDAGKASQLPASRETIGARFPALGSYTVKYVKPNRSRYR